MKTLYDYQEASLEDVALAYLGGHLRVVLVKPTGSGKTVTAAEAVRRAVERGRKVLWVVHRIELVGQAIRTLEEFGLTVGAIAASGGEGVIERPYAPVQVCMLQTLLARTYRPKADLLVWDECFVAGTLIDGRPIETLRSGDEVSAFSERDGRLYPRRVLRVMRRAPQALVRVCIGRRLLVCTPEHPFWTEHGWKPAKELTDERVLVRRNDSHPDFDALPCLLPPGDGQPQPVGAVPDTNASAQSDGERFGEGERFVRSASEGPSAASPRGQRQTDAATGFDAPLGPASSDARASDCNRVALEEEGRHTHLQGGPCGSGAEASHRGGRAEPRNTRATSPGPAKDSGLEWARVDGVEVCQPSRDGTFGGVCPDGFVYNLEVEDLHTYVADGVVVHNCHHCSEAAATWVSLLGAYPKAFVLGLTATPERGDGAGLAPHFTKLVMGVSVRQLTMQGRLVPCEVVQPKKRLAPGELAREPLDAYREHSPGQQGFLYARNVSEAMRYAAEFTAAGIPSACVHGKTPALEREMVLERFREGRLRLLTNVYVFTEGTDLPHASVCILARGAGTVGIYLQMIGRVLRPADGKSKAILIDLPGVSHIHGVPEEDRVWSLEGKACHRLGIHCQVCSQPIESYPCEHCGFDPENAGNAQATSVITGDPLVKYARKIAEGPEQRWETLLRWLRMAQHKGHKFWSVTHKWRSVYGEELPRTWFDRACAIVEGRS